MLDVVDPVDVTEKNKRKQLYPCYVQQHMKARVIFSNHVNNGVGIFFIFGENCSTAALRFSITASNGWEASAAVCI